MTHATTKVRPADPPPGAQSIALAAARNEFEAFQVVVHGPATGVRMSVRLDGFHTWLYREALMTVTTPSNHAGATGPWPDALVPDRDELYGETRNAFPFDVPAGENRVVWVDVLVPPGQPAGTYSGSVHVTADGGFTADVPISLEVWGFTLPSTASLGSAFGMGWADVCIAETGRACDDAGTIAAHLRYAAFALDHRLSISDVVYYGPDAAGSGWDWASWDAIYAPYLDGGAPTRLAGARMTQVNYVWATDSAHYAAWAQHFRQRGWLDRTFDYTCDEPPAGCAWGDILSRIAMVHAGDPQMRTMVTTSLDNARQHGFDGVLDILTPVVDFLDQSRASYDPWLAGNPQRELWWYFACEPASSCENGVVDGNGGWPNYIIDAPAIENRIMGFLSFSYGIKTELYFDTTYMYPHGGVWQSLYSYGNNGDGTLLYPGTPAAIGGMHPVPVASIRLKMIREGREDYEYLRLLSDAGDPQLAMTLARQVAPRASQFTEDPQVLYAARRQAAERIVTLTNPAPSPSPTDGGPSPSSADAGPSSADAGSAPLPVDAQVASDAAGTPAPGLASSGPAAGGCSSIPALRGSTGGKVIVGLVLLLFGRLRRRRS